MSANCIRKNSDDLYRGLRASARERLELRDYQKPSLDCRLRSTGVGAGELLSATDRLENWIPGFELIARRIFRQRNRGYFGELARQNEGVLERIGLRPAQWASAAMHPGSAKGFHIHPPHVPDGVEPSEWFDRLFGSSRDSVSSRPYDKEQWDVMFFVRGNAEIFLVDERAGLPRRKMRLIIDGDDAPGPNNAGMVVPAGVAHALRNESSQDLIMVYGTSTSFNPGFEGRIASGVETAGIDRDWAAYLGGGKDD